MATIEIRDVDNILIDGSNAGQIMDVVQNHKALASDVQRAFKAWAVAQAKSHQDALTAAATAASTAQADALAAAKSTADAAAAVLTAQVAEQATLIDVLGGTAIGQQMAADKAAADLQAKKDQLLAQIAAATAEIAAIDATASPVVIDPIDVLQPG